MYIANVHYIIIIISSSSSIIKRFCTVMFNAQVCVMMA